MTTSWPQDPDSLQTFVDELNCLEPRITFTSQSSPSSMVFLDLRVYKPADFATRGRLATSIHYKATNTFTYPMGMSHIDRHTFRGVAMGETI